MFLQHQSNASLILLRPKPHIYVGDAYAVRSAIYVGDAYAVPYCVINVALEHRMMSKTTMEMLHRI